MNRWMTCLFLLLGAECTGWSYSVAFPTAPAAGEAGSTAIYKNDEGFVSWADGYTNLVYGESVAPQWQVPANALGKAEGTSSDILCLGRGGTVTLVFSQGIADGAGFDFAVFENAIGDTFLELAWVEVSSDGIHFVRFPNFSDTLSPVGAFGAVDPTQIHGYAGKYRVGYGTPFDLSELDAVAASIAAGGHALTADYVAAFTNGLPYLDRATVKYVRLVDIVGNGSALDSEGYAIYDPYPTVGSAGFDLDAVGVINQSVAEGLPQQIAFAAIPHQKLAFGSVVLSAVSDSGLPVSYSVRSGPAVLNGNDLDLTGTGTVEVVAQQAGDSVFAPAVPVLRSFQVADEIQHIFFEQVPNQLSGGDDVQVRAYSSCGLPVQVEAVEAPDSVVVLSNQVMQLGGETGAVTLRAFQAGDAGVAPAEDVYVHFNIVAAGASNAPVSFADWLLENRISVRAIHPSVDVYGRSSIDLEYSVDLAVAAVSRVMESADLESWTNAVPEIVAQAVSGNTVHMTVRLPASGSFGFHRLEQEAQ